MTDSTRLAAEASAAPSRSPARARAMVTAAGFLSAGFLSGAIALSGLVLGCGPSDPGYSYGYGAQAGSAAGAYGQSGTTGASGTLSGATGTWSGAAGAAGTAGASGSEFFDAGVPTMLDGAVPPMVVELDPNGTLSATPGIGVGVFTQYVSGGHWVVWWTCDTSITGQACSFTVSVTPVQGTLSNVQSTQNGTVSAVAGATSAGFSLASSTSTARNQVAFDAPPGAAIELDAFVEPAPDQNYLFFVQNQRVNGGYQGDLTDPLILEPSSP